MSTDRPRVVIVGFGDTGVLTATKLSARYDVTAITTKPEFISGQELGLRLAFPQIWQEHYRFGYDRFRRLRGVNIVHGVAVGIDQQQRTVEVREPDGAHRVVAFDFLVIATGVNNGFWRDDHLHDREEFTRALNGAARVMREANSVGIVGGGAAAVATAAQMATAHPHLAVHLYFPRETALTQHHPKVWTALQRRLVDLGVHLHANSRAVLPAELNRLGAGTIFWEEDRAPVRHDVIVWATGQVRPHTDFVPATWCDDRGFVRVDQHLQVPQTGESPVFAVGDVAASDPLRTSARNQGHQLVAHNIDALHRGTRLKCYRPRSRRWGSVIGFERRGLEVFTPTGARYRIPGPVLRRLIQPLVVRRGIYGGIDPGQHR